MTFEIFQTNFPRDPGAHETRDALVDIPDLWKLREFFRVCGGASFGNGLYRIIHPAELGMWRDRVLFAFPKFEGRITCFGYDWLGRTFALDSNRRERGQYGVVMFEPGTGEALEIPSNLETFHDEGLTEFGEAALAIGFYREWLKNGGSPPSFSECIGYRKQLFLGGTDEIENLELTDIDVYWHISGQLIRKTRGLPLGSRVNVSIKRT